MLEPESSDKMNLIQNYLTHKSIKKNTKIVVLVLEESTVFNLRDMFTKFSLFYLFKLMKKDSLVCMSYKKGFLNLKPTEIISSIINESISEIKDIALPILYNDEEKNKKVTLSRISKEISKIQKNNINFFVKNNGNNQEKFKYYEEPINENFPALKEVEKFCLGISKGSKELCDLYDLMNLHIIEYQNNFIQFIQCNNTNCCVHQRSKEWRKEWNNGTGNLL